jgi:hypothetical protein
VQIDVPIPEVPMVSLTGRYDGASIVVSGGGAAEWTDVAEIDFTTPCKELRDGGGASQTLDTGVSAVNRLIAQRKIPLSGSWWDQDNGVYTVWLVGDPEQHRAAIESAAGEMPVCVTGGAHWTQKELEKAQRGAMRRLEPTGLMWYSSTDTFGNRAVLVVEAIDQKQLGDIESRFHDRAEVDAFIELLEDDLTDLPDPVPAHPGDLPIVTAQTRVGGGMAALGTFTLRVDRQRECLYLQGSGTRTLPTWPFGYSADANPGRVYDFDGNLVLRQGERFQMGGGFVPVDVLPPATDACGTSETFMASSPPEVTSAP